MKVGERPRLRARRAGLLGGLIGIGCCIYPVVLVLLGIATASEAVALGNDLYGNWGWVFRGAGLAALATAVVIQLRRRGQCSIEGAKANRGYLAAALVIAVAVYWLVYGITKLLAAWAPD